MSGMAFGSWFAERLYDHFGFYAPAFGAGVAFNVLNLVLLMFLVLRQEGPKSDTNGSLSSLAAGTARA